MKEATCLWEPCCDERGEHTFAYKILNTTFDGDTFWSSWNLHMKKENYTETKLEMNTLHDL